MKRLAKTIALLLLPLAVGTNASAQEPTLPVRVSENGRYFVDQNGQPIFWLGTTQWELFHGFTQDEAKTIIEKSKAAGFSVIQVMLTGVGDGTKPNVYRQKPWLTNDPSTPNEAYFKNEDAMLRMAGDNNMIVVVTVYHQTLRKYVHAREGPRLGKVGESVGTGTCRISFGPWCPRPSNRILSITRNLAAGLSEGGGNHLITVHPDPSPYSSSFLHDEDWLDFDPMQTWNAVKLIYPMVTYDYNLKPTKPVSWPKGRTRRARSTASTSRRSGFAGRLITHILPAATTPMGTTTVGGPLLPTWRQALDAPAVAQMGVLKKTFLARKQWWLLVPDQSLFESGGRISDRRSPLSSSTASNRTLMSRVWGRMPAAASLALTNCCIWPLGTRTAFGPRSIWPTRRRSPST